MADSSRKLRVVLNQQAFDGTGPSVREALAGMLPDAEIILQEPAQPAPLVLDVMEVRETEGEETATSLGLEEALEIDRALRLLIPPAPDRE